MFDTYSMNDMAKVAQAGAGAAVVFSIVYILVAIFALIIGYYIYCLPQEKIAKKLNAGSSWMAYVPIARNVQRMKMADMSTWKLFFVGGVATLVIAFIIIGIIAWILLSISIAFGLVVTIILILAYVILYYVFTFEYNSKIVHKFEYDKAFAIILTFAPGLNTVFYYIMAFDNRRLGDSGSKWSDVCRGSKQDGGSIEPPSPSGISGIEGVVGMYAGAQFEMKASDVFVIGRDSTLSNIIISRDGEKVSKRHCSIKYLPYEKCYEVTDFSSNGTFYGNNRLVKDVPTKIVKGTIIVLGDKTNQFKLM